MGAFIVNGQTYNVDVDPAMPLLWVLRDVLGVSGPKFGCGIGQCWGCTVLLDGKARPSCRVKAREAEDRQITTIEGIPRGHPVKRAWVQEQVPQCGYCQPGQILSAVALLSVNPDPSDAEIAGAMKKNLCRCGTYSRIKTAVKRAATEMKRGKTAGALLPQSPPEVSAGDTGDDHAFNPFVRISSGGLVTVISKHLEAGQGIYTGLSTILAEELDADWSQVRVEAAPADERLYNNLFFGPAQATGGSTSIANSYEQYRRARAMLIAAAAGEWLVPAEEITVAKGALRHAPSGRRAGFGELARKASGMTPPEDVPLKDPKSFAFIGKLNNRIDMDIKVQGTAQYGILSGPGRMISGAGAIGPCLSITCLQASMSIAIRLPGVIASSGNRSWRTRLTKVR